MLPIRTKAIGGTWPAPTTCRASRRPTRPRAHRAYDIALTKKSGEGSDVDLKSDLQSWVKSIDQIFATAAEEEKKKRRDALLAAQKTVDTKSPALQKAAETLAARAREETTAEHGRLLQKFAKDAQEARADRRAHRQGRGPEEPVGHGQRPHRARNEGAGRRLLRLAVVRLHVRRSG